MFDAGDILGAIWKVRDWPTYWPPGFARWWIAAIVLVAVLPALWFRFVDKQYHAANLARQEQTARLQNLEKEGFNFVAALSPPQNSTASRVEIRARTAAPQDDGSVVQDVALVYPDSVSRFSYVVLAGNALWQIGSTTSFEGGEHGVVVTDALRRDYVEALVKDSDKVVCVGLASSERALPEENTRLSDDRAINLCRALLNIRYADATRQDLYGLSLGEGPAVPAGTPVSLQRTVIIIGVINAKRLPRPTDIVQALTQLITVPGVRVDLYRRNQPPSPQTFARVQSGPLNGRASGNWTAIPAEDNPLQ